MIHMVGLPLNFKLYFLYKIHSDTINKFVLIDNKKNKYLMYCLVEYFNCFVFSL